MKKFLLYLVIVITGAGFTGCGGNRAYVKLSKEKIPENIPEKVRLRIQELSFQDPAQRAHAAYQLGEMGQKASAAVPFLIDLLDDRTSFYKPKFLRGCLTVGEIAQEALVCIGEPSVEPLINALNTIHWRTRRNAAEALGEIKDTRAVDPLIILLKDPNRYVRRNAVWALKEINNDKAVIPIIPLLKDNNPLVRETAANALGDMKAHQAVKALICALQDKDFDVRGSSAWALGKIGDPRAIEPLIYALNDEDSQVRWRSQKALQWITGENFGQNTEKWHQWLQKSRNIHQTPVRRVGYYRRK